jgi:poly-gamma-glutamate synthesis protein (capsule biosynthesis protein)
MDRRRFLALAGGALLGGWTGETPPVRRAATRAGMARETSEAPAGARPIVLLLCGDVMTGRGIDQVLPHPSAPHLFEPVIDSAIDYVLLAERESGPIPRRVDFSYVWGDALAEFARARPDVRIVNLETAVTTSEDAWPGKGIHYRMHPGNAPCLEAAGIDCCVLANNHLLDWGRRGLQETLDTLHGLAIRTSGAGRDTAEAAAPAILEVPGGRVLVFAFGARSSGVPRDWEATRDRSGVRFLADFSEKRVEEIARQVASTKQPGDVVAASVHWGGNWGFEIPAQQRAFAERLIDVAGVDVVHGHSSHHVKGMQVHRGKLILYGCGDLLTDYEGIRGREEFRGDLGLLYFAAVDPASGRLVRLRMTPTRVRRFRLERALGADARWLRETLDHEGRSFGTGVEREPDETFLLRWDGEGVGAGARRGS